MAQSQRASMREGPLADLFRSTLGDEGARPVEPAAAEPDEPAAAEPVEPAAAEPAEPATPQEEVREPPGELEPPSELAPDASSREAIEADLRSAEVRLERARDDDDELARTLEALEADLLSAKQWTDRAWDRALVLLTEYEARASEAERNAARAEELARRRGEQTVWERRLRVLLDRIGHYERRAAAKPSAQRYVGS
jgi:hypothetical protein